MKKRFLALIPLSGLLLAGAGCGSTVPSSASDDAFERSRRPPVGLAVPEPPPSSTETSTMQTSWEFPGVLPASEISGKQVRLKTTKGDIVFELFDQEAPKTVSGFVYLAKGGFYDGLTFHRRVEGFVIQGGDPNGDGTGGPGYKFEDEPVKRKYDRGIVAMANSGPDTNGSQFFIMLADYGLPPSYTIFGKVTSGMGAVDKIAIGDAMTKVTVEDKN